ncbi:MAG: peptidylprolyl isomerase [Deltaproteobacteria bacterium]|nr:peptidylprolyl isomerase [Deltaproteobacteria bacterium]
MVTEGELRATMKTDKGDIHLRLFGGRAPVTVSNFINLAQRGFYDNLNFHRVIADFMVQGGCPTGNGTGGPGYKFEDEFVSELRHDKPGRFSMANSGPRTNGSQFFITHVPTPWLDDKHTIFGEVEVVNAVAQGDKILSITIEGDPAALLEQTKDRMDQWNGILD